MLGKQMWMKYAPEMLVEWKQMMDEGKNVEHLRKKCEEIVEQSKTTDCEEAALEIFRQMENAPKRSDYPYEEPSAYDEIRQCVEGNDEVSWEEAIGEERLKEKIAGAWIGRISGCLLGKPMECLKSGVIRTILEDTENYPMNRYVDSREFPEELPQKVRMDRFSAWQKCWIDKVGGKAPVDDDTNYTVLNMRLIDEYGADFKPDDVLEAWLYWMPMFSACTAERVAYRNAAGGMYAPQTAAHMNPYREWIGAQIRGDFFGYLNPGNPQKAAGMAWRDASISHVKNGIYGEMFIAAMLAKAAVCDDIKEVITCGLKEIPAASRLSEKVKMVMKWYDGGVVEQDAFEKIHTIYDEYDQHHWCHTVSNAMIVAAALLYGEKDFGHTISRAVQTGFDTDCNGATAGSVLGMMLGEKRIPNQWPDGFNRKLQTSINGYYEVTVDQLVDKTMQLIHRVAR